MPQEAVRVIRCNDRQLGLAVELLRDALVVLSEPLMLLLIQSRRYDVTAVAVTLEAAPDLPEVLSLRDRRPPGRVLVIMITVAVATGVARVGHLEVHKVMRALPVVRSDLVLQVLDILADAV